MEILNGQKIKIVSKKTILLYKGDIGKTIFKVIKGCLKSYVIDSTGKEHIIQFAPEGWYIGDLDSFINNKPAAIFIDAIEDSEVLPMEQSVLSIIGLDKSALIELNNMLFRKIISINNRLITLLSATGEERYMEFMKMYPTLAQRLPLKLISSYIGITPEYLSEIRRKIAHN